MAYNHRTKKPSSVQTLSKEEILDAIEKFGTEDEPLSFGNITESSFEKKIDKTNVYGNECEDSLQEEWNQLFLQSGFIHKIKADAMNGNLGTHHFRSICWRIFWKCLSENPSSWIHEVEEQRKRYSLIRNKYLINPYEQEKELDLKTHHPLSQSEDSVWHKYFQDNELRSLIVIDLDRLSPELDFFQNDNIRSIILHVLFCYAREKPEVSYKQGMHEIVSVIIYVIMKNAMTVRDSKEKLRMEDQKKCCCKTLRKKRLTQSMETFLIERINQLKTIMDINYVENDSYILFAKIMNSIQPWFTNLPQPQSPKQVSAEQRIFRNPAEIESVTAMSEKLNHIQGYMLKKYDSALCQHLQKIEISPQLYGIRWMRLLFGREFPLNRLLTIWDALFADGALLDLVDYVFLAMLINLRGVLLQNDFNVCLSYLMKYPANTDSRFILKQALLLRSYQPQMNADHDHVNKGRIPTSQRKVHPVRNRLGKTREQLFSQSINSINKDRILQNEKAEGLDPVDPSSDDHESAESPSLFNETSSRLASQISQFKTKVNSIQNPLKGMVSSKQTKGVENTGVSHEDSVNLQEQLFDMQTEFSKLHSLCVYCGDKMDSYISLLQHRLLKEEMFNDEIAILSIAGLKQIREIFKAGPNLNLLDHEVDFKDIDRHIASASHSKKLLGDTEPISTVNKNATILVKEASSLLDNYSHDDLRHKEQSSVRIVRTNDASPSISPII